MFLVEDVVLKFGVFRELLTDRAPEMVGKVIEQLVDLLQAKQTTPVPYRPQRIGLVERFHRSWKDCVSTFMSSNTQDDWNMYVKFAVYVYNSARHTTVALTPNELMMGRRLRAPNELLRRTEVTEAGELVQYHKRLLVAKDRGRACAEEARIKEQSRQARYYNRKCYENYVLQREDKNGAPEIMIAHVSFLVSYHYPKSLLQQVAADLNAQLDDEDQGGDAGSDATATRAAVRAATAARGAAPSGRTSKRRRSAMGGATAADDEGGRLVETRRRRRRNKAGQYVLEYELRAVGRTGNGG
ncbi:hypothetical protein PR001_g10849 [Phytophthora rubi]|uniref:Integrase catalytic domain-containing protein n=1 Tax=Phytophthora rubi TaxID=129364 RepID=A0A6A3MR12_9STRA|nr:hypothetical protein PR001_g10849 [Phytophthora rubi]